MSVRGWIYSVVDYVVYDNLNRVIQVNTQTGVAAADTGLYLPASMWSGTSTSIAVTYDVLGNITSKTDIGTYGYGETRGTCSSVTGAMASAGPRAVSSTSGTSTADYCYDANGNLLSGDGRSVTWTDFGKPERITRGSNTVDISYGPDRARYKRVDTSATSTTTTRYIGGKLYEAIDRAGALEQKHYIGGFAVITVHVATNVTETRYMLTDHLGSVDTIMEASGSVVERMSFDPWGKRRQINWVPINDPAGYMPLVTTRGFTNHEQLDPVGLVHMNGRVYDPELGRFLSADIVVQDVTNLQSWNAYSYVLNNPLSYTDPTGFFFKSLFKAIGNFFKGLFKAVKSVVKAIARNPIVSAIVKIATCAPFGPGIGACLGATAALTIGAGGSLADALIATALSIAQIPAGAIVDSIVAEVAKTAAGLAHIVGVAAQGVVQGAMTVAQGGEFLAGFVAGAIGAAGRLAAGTLGNGNIIMETAIVATAGGIGAELSGGKFANGAVTAAFAFAAGRIGEYQRENSSLGTQSSEFSMRANCYRYAAYSCKNQLGFGGSGGGGKATPLPPKQVVHGNSARSQKPTVVYTLVDRITNVIRKIGITSNPKSRYSQPYLDRNNLRFQTEQVYQTRYPAIIHENIRLYHHRIDHGKLPDLNKTTR